MKKLLFFLTFFIHLALDSATDSRDLFYNDYDDLEPKCTPLFCSLALNRKEDEIVEASDYSSTFCKCTWGFMEEFEDKIDNFPLINKQECNLDFCNKKFNLNKNQFDYKVISAINSSEEPETCICTYKFKPKNR